MNWLAEKTIKHKGVIIIAFTLMIVFSIFAAPNVSINYQMADYLPEDSKSTVSLNLMNKEFDKSPPNVRIMLEDVSIAEALNYKEKISKVNGVKEINWLDDSVNIQQPLDMIDTDTLNSWYKDNNALFTALVDKGDTLKQTIEDIKEIVGDKGIVAGDAVTENYAKTSTSEEIQKIMLFIVPVIVLILMISTSSWFEPFLFLFTVGISILINSGTNIFLGEISFITNATAAILQLAVSMDYAIFLLHRFSEFREEGLEVKEAIVNAMKKSYTSILSSGLTTILGFLALTLMRFKIGPDLGIVLAKGIVFSLLAVMLLLPVLTIYTYKIIDKTAHRSFMPSFEKFSKIALKVGPIFVIIVAIVVYPAYLAQGKNNFTYGASSMASSEKTQIGKDTKKIDDTFGKSNQIVFIVPADDPVDEKEIGEEINNIEGVTSIISYSNNVGNEIPKDYVPKEQLSDLVSGDYSRMIITISADEESDIAFNAVKEMSELGKKYFGDNYYIAGGSPSAYDIRETVTSDNVITTLGAIIAIGVVIMLTYRSLSIPIILLIAIESSIWINLSYSYFNGVSIAYIGFMVISAVQLGATVDYAILFANGYLENRKEYNKHDSAINTLKSSTGAILTSGTLLAIAGFTLGKISTNEVIAQLGILIGRGALLSMTSVLFFLPTVLIICDKLIEKTTMKVHFYKEGEKNEQLCKN